MNSLSTDEQAFLAKKTELKTDGENEANQRLEQETQNNRRHPSEGSTNLSTQASEGFVGRHTKRLNR